MGDLVDNEQIDFAVIQVLEEFVKIQRKGKALGAHTFFARNELM